MSIVHRSIHYKSTLLAKIRSLCLSKGSLTDLDDKVTCPRCLSMMDSKFGKAQISMSKEFISEVKNNSDWVSLEGFL